MYLENPCGPNEIVRENGRVLRMCGECHKGSNGRCIPRTEYEGGLKAIKQAAEMMQTEVTYYQLKMQPEMASAMEKIRVHLNEVAGVKEDKDATEG